MLKLNIIFRSVCKFIMKLIGEGEGMRPYTALTWTAQPVNVTCFSTCDTIVKKKFKTVLLTCTYFTYLIDLQFPLSGICCCVVGLI